MLPSASIVMPEAPEIVELSWFATSGSGMNAATLASLILPMKLPRSLPGLVLVLVEDSSTGDPDRQPGIPARQYLGQVGASREQGHHIKYCSVIAVPSLLLSRMNSSMNSCSPC